MISSIIKKKSVSNYLKISEIIYNSLAFTQNILYINWNDLELLLNKIIDKIKLVNIKFDYVIGIKTGGAIISDYISNKLNLKNYKIKISNKKYNKKTKNTMVDCIDKYIMKRKNKYMISEKINDDLSGKNVILIDELVASGDTIYNAYNYLKNEKKVSNIYITSIVLNDKFYKYDLHIEYLFTSQIHVYPWGYDN
jgi:hypoxanthine phosphoribosyltransferase